jgi:RNA polymerase primary sigma factor
VGQERSSQIPPHLIETINRLVRASRQMLQEVGHEPTPEELAARVGMPLETVRKLMGIAREPFNLHSGEG